MVNIYLAGPDVFLPDPQPAAAAKQAICAAHGFVGKFPLDNTLDFTGMTPNQMAWAIYRSNISLMNDCDLIIANMTPFRGPSMDVGTAFEMGYMAAQGKPVYGYSNDRRLYIDRVPAFAPGLDATGQAIEAFELHDNLMLEGAIYASNGAFRGAEVDRETYHTNLTVFEAVVKLAAKHLLNRQPEERSP